jgi:serine/threonine-protein kinase SRPK3
MKLTEIIVVEPDVDVSPATEDKKNTAMEESARKRIRFDAFNTPTASAISYVLEETEDDDERRNDEDPTPKIDSEEAGIEVAELEKGEGKIEAPLEPTYMLPSFDDVEEIEAYHPGGHHPVAIGDRVGGQYKIIHKLGYGGFGTVWLARDTQEQRYVALKIIMARSSTDAMKKDLKILKHLAKHVERPGANFIDLPIEDFWITGPNGKHLCIVSEVAGPSLAHLTRTYSTKIDPVDARRMALQIAQCLAFLHSKKVSVAHGDLTTSNVLLELGSLDSMPQEKLLEILGEPVGEKVKSYTGKALGPGAPELVYHSADMMKLKKFFSGNIIIIDFGAAFFLDKPPEDIGTPAPFCSPELLLNQVTGKPSDVWALACTIFEMRTGELLFESFAFGEEDVLQSMIGALGPLPEKLLDKEEHEWLKNPKGDGNELDELVFAIKGISEDEKVTLYDLLRQALRYDTQERLMVDEMLRHPWFSYNLHLNGKATIESGTTSV